ncbi:MAG: hypothetical protein ACOY3K_03185 [Candidatus Omnitrophota bacterium]
MKPDPALGSGSRGFEQFFDGLEYDSKLLIVFLFPATKAPAGRHFLDLSSQICMSEHKLAQLCEGSHDLDIYIYGFLAIENAG